MARFLKYIRSFFIILHERVNIQSAIVIQIETRDLWMSQIVRLARPATLLNNSAIAELFTIFLDRLLSDMKLIWT